MRNIKRHRSYISRGHTCNIVVAEKYLTNYLPESRVIFNNAVLSFAYFASLKPFSNHSQIVPFYLCGDLGGIRTPNTRLRTAVFYPLNYQAGSLGEESEVLLRLDAFAKQTAFQAGKPRSYLSLFLGLGEFFVGSFVVENFGLAEPVADFGFRLFWVG